MTTSESTTFTLDNMGRFLCNALPEALDSANQTVAGRKRDFDVIVIGGGTFGSVITEHLFVTGGRSLTWGGWSPELLSEEMAAWPQTTRDALRPPAGEGYFAQASRQIGVKETNDFIYGPLHTALRKQLHAGLKAAANLTGFTFTQLLDHPALRYPDLGEPPIDAKLLRDWLGLPATDTTPLPELRDLFKLEAPLAVQSTTLPDFFPTNKFSAVPALIRAARLATTEADGIGAPADARKRLMIVPN